MFSETRFEIEFLSEASDFILSLDEKSRDKILYNLKKAQFVSDSELFKKLTENIWEFRTLFNGNSYRLFAFWDKSPNQKTPQKEIRKAEEIPRNYLENKQSHGK